MDIAAAALHDLRKSRQKAWLQKQRKHVEEAQLMLDQVFRKSPLLAGGEYGSTPVTWV